MNVFKPAFLLFVAAVFLYGACGSEEPTDLAPRCVQGQTIVCACAPNVLGIQFCDAQGYYGSCLCEDLGITPSPDGGDVADAGDTAPADATDTGEGGQRDAAGDGDGGDSGDLSEALRDVGESCTQNADCLGELCLSFSSGRFCSMACQNDCDLGGEDWLCFNRMCTPADHCDLTNPGAGVGPGCLALYCGACPEHSTCESLDFGRYECVCAAGARMSPDGLECLDIDECATGTHSCSENEFCHNTRFSHECVCAPGFWGASCQACPGGEGNVCTGNGVCEDGPTGSGLCICEPRFRGDSCNTECFEIQPVLCAGANFREAALNAVSFVNGDISGADFELAWLQGANLINTTGHGTNFRAGQMTGAHLELGSDFTNANFEGANLHQAQMHDSSFQGANLSAASLSQAVATDSNFQNAIFSFAIMHGAELSGSNCRGTDLSHVFAPSLLAFGTDFSNANFTQATLMNAQLTGALLDGANFSFADLYGVTGLDPLATGIIWRDTICPDGTNSDTNGGNCDGHL